MTDETLDRVKALPCPWCGEDSGALIGSEDWGWRVECYCGVMISPKQAAIDAWNRRADSPELARLEAERDEARGALARAEEARRLEEAAALEAEGRREEAEQVLDEEPALIEAPIAPPPTPKVAGVSMREKWTAEVTDKAAFVRAVAANPSLLGLVDANAGALNQMASALKSDLKIPGVNVRREQVVSARGRATGRRGVAVTPASVAKRVKSLLELEAAEGPLVSGETEGA